MDTILVDFQEKIGKIKVMNAVNNGPVHKEDDQTMSNLHWFQNAKIPYARTHDASIYYGYGREHCVDVNGIFPNFDADVNDEKNYDFALTDFYLGNMIKAGVEPFYRLGSCIEHWVKKYNTAVPKDYLKWAQICEHIIRHYTEGWANGFSYRITYWEIWNEPDLDPDDSLNKRTWQGTKQQYFDFYHVVANHLKTCFPHLKIGGPAIAHDLAWAQEFLSQLGTTPLDFFSWHIYDCTVEKFVEKTARVRALLDRYGYQKTESILNEWNYVKGWNGDDWLYTIQTEKNHKGASFISAVMCAEQNTSLDLLMYYDARPTCMNGLFHTDMPCNVLKGYYPFVYFLRVYERQNQVKWESDKNVYGIASANENGASVFFTYYNDDDNAEKKEFSLSLRGMGKGKKTIRIERTSKNVDHEVVRQMVVSGKEADIQLPTALYDIVSITIENQ